MKKIIFTLLILIVTLTTSNLFSQVLPASEVQINLSPLVDQEISDAIMDTLTDSFYLIQQETQLKIALNITIQDTNQISKINIKLGTTLGGIEFMNQSFTYDQANPGTGLSYVRKVNFVTLGLGTYANTTNALYYSEVEIEDALGNKSTIIQTNTSQ